MPVSPPQQKCPPSVEKEFCLSTGLPLGAVDDFVAAKASKNHEAQQCSTSGGGAAGMDRGNWRCEEIRFAFDGEPSRRCPDECLRLFARDGPARRHDQFLFLRR